MISIEKSTDAHLITSLNEAVQSWHHENYPNHFKAFNGEAILPYITSMLADTNVTAFVASYNENPSGYLLCIETVRPENPFQFEDRFLQLDQIAVLPEFRGKGIASELFSEAEHLAKSKGISNLRLDHWQQNDIAASFFQKMGFTYYNQRMWKNLT